MYEINYVQSFIYQNFCKNLFKKPGSVTFNILKHVAIRMLNKRRKSGKFKKTEGRKAVICLFTMAHNRGHGTKPLTFLFCIQKITIK
jgi:hypothetical protein